MNIKALATDYDGTLAWEGCVTDETVRALERLQKAGIRRILVTGRELPDLLAVCDRPDLFDVMILENGAVLYDPASGRKEILCEPPPEAFLEKLKQKIILPLAQGEVILATIRLHEPMIRDILESLSCPWQITLNKNSLMILPPGVDKASGLKTALDKMGLEFQDVAGIGDAENDLCFLNQCRFSAAVGNALPLIQEKTHLTTSGTAGNGVIELIDRLLRYPQPRK